MNTKKIFTCLALAIYCVMASAQIQMTAAQKENAQRRCAEKVAQFQDYVSFIGSKKKNLDNRRYYKTKALNLHIGKGDQYTENGENKDGVMMQTSSKKTKKITNTLTRDYLEHLIGLKYSDVKILSSEVCDIKVSNLQQIDDNLYVCTCQYDQKFIGYKDGRPIYQDITTKHIKCYVTLISTEVGNEFIVLLGDATVDKTI